MRYGRLLACLLCFWRLVLSAEEPSSLAVTDPSLIVAGVSLLTGLPIMETTDLVLPGVDGVAFQRHFECFSSSMTGGWEPLPQLTLHLEKQTEARSTERWMVTVADGSGHPLFFCTEKRSCEGSFEYLILCGTNNTGAAFSARQNPTRHKLSWLQERPKGSALELTLADGTVRKYYSDATEAEFKSAKNVPYRLLKETFPTGNYMECSYNKETLSEITTYDSMGKKITSAKIEKTGFQGPKGQWKGAQALACFKPMHDMTRREDYSFQIHLEDGRSMRYGLGAYSPPVKESAPYWFLPVVVEGFGRCTEVLEYAFEQRQVKALRRLERVPVAISKVSYADGSYRRYERETQGRVVRVLVPNVKGQEAELYRFKWEKNGDVEVVDGHKGRRRIHFDAQKCPISAECYLDNQMLGQERWVWGRESYPCLRAKVMIQGSADHEEILRVDEYTYDKQGNLTQHKLHGPYNGASVQWEWSGDFPTCSEHVDTAYQYNDRHLLIRQDEPEGRFQVFEWEHDRVLCTAHFMGAAGRIVERTFNFYDDAANLVRVITDNGSSQQIDDWTDVTHRQETRFKLNQGAIAHHLPLKKTVQSLSRDGSSKLLYEEQFEYDLSGQPTVCRHYDERGHLLWTKTAAYKNGLKVSECSPVGGVFSWDYDVMRRLIEERGPCGERTRYEYGMDGFCAKEHRWDGVEELTTQRLYHPDGLPYWESSPEGWTSLYSYGHLGRCTQVRSLRGVVSHPIPSPRPMLQPQYARVTTTYDLLGRVISRQQGNETCSYTYSVHDLPLEEKFPDGTRRTWRRDQLGQVLQSVEPDGSSMRYRRDALGRVFRESRECQATQRTYHQEQLVTEVDPLGHTTRYGYDSAGRMSSMDREGQVTKLLYDSDGRPCGTVRSGLEDRSLLNAVGDPIERTVTYEGELQSKETWDLDVKGRKIAHRIWDGEREAISQWTYDLLDRMTSQTDPMGICIQTRYSRIKAPQDSYYAQVREQIHPNGLIIKETSSFYCALTQQRSAQHGEKVLWEEMCSHDQLDRLISVQRTCSDMPEQIFEWSYLPGGQLQMERHRALDQSLETRYRYNRRGQLVHKQLPNGHWLAYEYDSIGRITETTSSDPACEQTVAYDLLNRPIVVTTPAGMERTVYDTWGNISREELSNGLVLQHRYDDLNQRIFTELPTGLSFTWTYAGQALRNIGVQSAHGHSLYEASVEMDLCGRVRALHSPYGSTRWSYDLCSRLQKIVHPEWSGEVLRYTERGQIADRKTGDTRAHVQYDELGHLTAEEGQTTQCFELNGFGQRTSVNGESCSLNPFGHPLVQGKMKLQWSQDGKLQHLASPGKEVGCQWDAVGRLTSLSCGQQKQAFQYDSRHRCMKRTFDDGDQLHLYAGRHHLGFLQDGKLTARLLLPGVCETGCVIAVMEDREVRETLCDLQGSIIWVEGAGSTSYDAFGQGEKLLCPWGYRSKWVLPDLQWYDFGRRVYAPELGIFISPDPKGLQEGWWAHHYCQHAPLGAMDAWGENIALARTVEAISTPDHRGLGQKAIRYLCSPYRCQWPEAMHRFIKSPRPKRLYFISTGVDNTVEEHLRVLKLVANCQPDDNFLIVGIYRPKDYNVITRFFYAAKEGRNWQHANPTSEGLAQFIAEVLQEGKNVGGSKVFDEGIDITFLGHSAGANAGSEVGSGLEQKGVLGASTGVSIAGASPVLKQRDTGSWRRVHHIYTRGDPVAHFGNYLRNCAIEDGFDCGTMEWIRAAPGDDAHPLFGTHHLEAASTYLGLPLSLDRLEAGPSPHISRFLHETPLKTVWDPLDFSDHSLHWLKVHSFQTQQEHILRRIQEEVA